MFKKILKGLGVLLLVLLVVLGGWMTLNWKHIRNLAEVNSAWYAQNTCACVFVTQRSEASCKDYTRQILPLKSIQIDRKKKTVTATATAIALWNTNVSKYEGPRYGCRLVTKK